MTSMRRWPAFATAILCLAGCKRGDVSEGTDPAPSADPAAASSPARAAGVPPPVHVAPAPVPLVPASFASIARRADPSVVTITTTEEEPGVFPGHRRLR